MPKVLRRKRDALVEFEVRTYRNHRSSLRRRDQEVPRALSGREGLGLILEGVHSCLRANERTPVGYDLSDPFRLHFLAWVGVSGVTVKVMPDRETRILS